MSRAPGSQEPVRPEVYRITSAAGSHSADMQQRAARYLLSMGIRTVCVILVIIVPGPLRWVFAVGAIGLPYIAVVAANAAGDRRQRPAPPPPPRAPRGLERATPAETIDAESIDAESIDPAIIDAAIMDAEIMDAETVEAEATGDVRKQP